MDAKLTDKIIFLDIDGVVNTLQIDINPYPNGRKSVDSIFYYDICSESDERVSNRQAIMWLNKLCLETRAMIVITSTWRLHTPYNVEQCLRNSGLLDEIKIIGKTPRIGDGCRGDEISWWLGSKFGEDSNKVSFVILDDDSDMGELIDHLVQCNTYHGFGYPEYDKAKTILNN